MNIKNIKTIIILLSLTTTINAIAQQKEEYNENVIINVGFNPIVTDANKINENPTIFDTSFSQINLSFEKIDKGYKTHLRFDTIKAATVKGEPTVKLYNLNLKAGLGFATSKHLSQGFVPLVQASYTSLRDRHLLWGADVFVRSIITKTKDYGHAGYSDNELNLWGKKIFDSYSATARVYASYDRHYYYGNGQFDSTFMPITTMQDRNKSNYLNSYTNLGFDLAYTKLKRDNSLQHNSFFSFNYTNGKQGAKEIDLHFVLDASKEMNFFGNTSQTIGLTFDYKHSFFKFEQKFITQDTTFTYPTLYTTMPLAYGLYDTTKYSQGRAIFNFAPYFVFDWNRFNFFASLSIIPKINGYNDFQILPTITISTELVQNILSIYAGLKSHDELMTLYNMHKINPFLAPNSHLEESSTNNLFAKLILNITTNVQATLEAGITQMNNYAFFYNFFLPEMEINNAMGINYADAKRYYITLQTHYNPSKIFNINFEATYQKVTRDDDFLATYQPKFIANLNATYAYKDLLCITLKPTLKTKQKAWFLEQEKEIKATFDLNLNATYNYNAAWSFFLDLENLAFQDYQTYYDYPVYSFIGTIGAKYRF